MSFIDNGDGTGRLLGTPGATDGGDIVVSLFATDTGNGGLSEPLPYERSSWSVSKSPMPPPVLDFIGDRIALAGEAFSVDVTASDLEQDPLLFEALGLPPVRC